MLPFGSASWKSFCPVLKTRIVRKLTKLFGSHSGPEWEILQMTGGQMLYTKTRIPITLSLSGVAC